MSNPAQTSPPPSAGPGVWKSILMLTPTLSLVFSAALISAQFPSVTYALALQVGGTNMMMITCLLTLVAHGAQVSRLDEEDWAKASDAVKGWRRANEQVSELEATWPPLPPSLARPGSDKST